VHAGGRQAGRSDLDALTAAIKSDGVTVKGSTGQTRTHPAINEVRQHRLALGRLLAQLALPNIDGASIPKPSSRGRPTRPGPGGGGAAMARRRSPAAVDVDATAVPVELLDWDHPVWSDRHGFEVLLDRIDPGRRHPSDLPDHPGMRFDHAARVYASVNGMVDPRRPGGYVRSLAAVGVHLAGTRRRLGTSGDHGTG